jgi:hypothetical protein
MESTRAGPCFAAGLDRKDTNQQNKKPDDDWPALALQSEVNRRAGKGMAL